MTSTCISAEVADLQHNFRCILLNFRQQFRKGDFDLASFKDEILHLPASERLKELHLLQNSRRSIKDASSFEDIIRILDSYWNYLDYRLLEILVKKSRSEKLCHKMQRYADKVEQFKTKHVVEDFKKEWNRGQSSPPGFVLLSVQFDRMSKECNFQQLDITALCSHFSLHPAAVLLNEIQCNPLTVTWLLPPFIAPQLREDMANVNQENLTLIKEFSIAAITLHGDEVFNSEIASKLERKLLDQMKALDGAGTQINTFGYHLVDEMSDDSEYVCPITKELMLNPLVTTCCGERMSKNAVKSSEQQCTYCKQLLNTRDDKSFLREVKKLCVYCKNQKLGCQWKGQLGDLSDHLKSSSSGCMFESIRCDDCHHDVQRSNKDKHKMEECPQRQLECDYCNFSSSYEDVMSHQLACGSRSIRCPNKCGCESLQCKEWKHHLDHCQLQLVQCKYSHEGCTAKVQRKDLHDHMIENIDQHLYMIKQKLEVEIEGLKCRQLTNQHLPLIIPELTIYYTTEKGSTSWFSPPFYTHNGGYRMCLRVDVAGYDEGAGTDVSAYIHLMRGIFDGDLKFPFQGEVTVQLVNQLEDGKPSEYHRERTIVFNEKTIHDHGRRVEGPQETQVNGWSVDQLVSHKMLEVLAGEPYQYVTQVGNQKCMKFRILRTVVYSM